MSEEQQESNKRSREEEEEEQHEDEACKNPRLSPADGDPDVEEDVEEEPQNVHYIHWKYLTTQVLTECVSWSDLKIIQGKCGVVWINFNHKRFAELCPDAPPLHPRRGRLYTVFPWLKTPFGYSPYKTNGNISNNLRLLYTDYADKAEGEAFEKRVEEWDNWFIDQIFANTNAWHPKVKLEKGETLTRKHIQGKYCAIKRIADKEGFPDYTSLKFLTQNEDLRKGIAADKTISLVNVWNADRELITDCLTDENNTARDDAKIIIGKNDYCRGTFYFQKLFFSADSGPTCVVDELMVETEERLLAKTGQLKKCSL